MYNTNANDNNDYIDQCMGGEMVILKHPTPFCFHYELPE
jgi:hypothetical protein